MAQQRNERVGRTEKVALTFTHGHVLKRQLVGSCYKAEGAQRRAQEEGDTCIIMADFHCCLAETDTTL